MDTLHKTIDLSVHIYAIKPHNKADLQFFGFDNLGKMWYNEKNEKRGGCNGCVKREGSEGKTRISTPLAREEQRAY